MQNSKTTIIGGIVAVILLVSGIAWASGVGESSSETLPQSSSTSLDDNGSSTSLDDNGSSTSLDDDGSTSSTLVDDSTSSTVDDSTTSTTIDDNTSSTIDDNSTTSTTIDDNTSSTVDDNGSPAIADGARSYSIDGVAVVTVNIVSGQLELVGINLESGWSAEVEKERSDRIEVEFRNGEQEAEFEVRLDNGRLRVEAEVKD
jgi:hypothetical protein